VQADDESAKLRRNYTYQVHDVHMELHGNLRLTETRTSDIPFVGGKPHRGPKRPQGSWSVYANPDNVAMAITPGSPRTAGQQIARSLGKDTGMRALNTLRRRHAGAIRRAVSNTEATCARAKGEAGFGD
jgi:hypothetical protein